MFTNVDIWKTIVSSFGVIISAFCVRYVHTKLKLNKIIQWQLLGMAIHHLLAFMNIFIAMIIKYCLGYLPKLVCVYGTVSTTTLYSGCQVFSSAISLSRFYIVWCTKKLKYPKDWIMIASTLLAIGMDLAVVTAIWGVQAYFELPGMIAVCNGFEVEDSAIRTGWIVIFWIGSVSALGVAGDIGLKRYLKARQNEGQEIQLVPWKSGGEHIPEESKATIPVRATLITFCNNFLFVVSVIIILTMAGYEHFTIVALFAYGCVQVPLIIGLTVKLNQTKVAPQQPIQKLHFHDDSLDEDDLERSEPAALSVGYKYKISSKSAKSLRRSSV